ncbi:MAG: hypothetical protein ACJAXE_001681 [Neolewinella sp.]|jgi:hypothetical protein
MDWATHFANWLDARFYVLTLKVARELSDRVFGRDAAQLRFSRDLAAKNYGLLTQSSKQRTTKSLPDPITKNHLQASENDNPVVRYLNQMSADIVNLAMWQMTALDWRTQYPLNNPSRNMRDFATTEELHTVSTLQITMRELQEQNFTSEEILDRLSNKAPELLAFYCDTEDKQHILEKAREQRGW